MNYSIDYLVKLIDVEAPESSVLEYKAGAALARTEEAKKEIIKDVSAFANSAGGTLIYGIAESVAKKGTAGFFSGIDRALIPPEWLEQIISQISPRIPDIRISVVDLAPRASGSCYIVDVPAGITAHQAVDFRYYRRYNFQSVPMADYEVRDVMNRSKHPSLHATVCGIEKRGKPEILVQFENVGLVMARYYAAKVQFPVLFKSRPFRPEGATYVTDQNQAYWEFDVSNGIGVPLFPKKKIILGVNCEWIPALPGSVRSADKINLWLYADSMPPIQLVKDNVPHNFV